MKHFSIIIPTLNEADNIQPLLMQISEVTQPHGMEPEVIFVDDGSTDGTRQQIKEYSGKLDVLLIPRDTDQGLASAVIAGARAASNEFVMVMDADLSHPVATIPALLEPLEKRTHDMVIGSRFIEGGETPNWPLIRRLGSQLASIPARFFTQARDPLSGFFAISRAKLIAVDSTVAGFKIGLEILAKEDTNFRVHEVPISFTDRQRGFSKMNSTVLKQYLSQLCRLSSAQPFITTLPLLLVLGLAAGLLDYAFFSLFTKLGYTLETSHIASLLASMHICYCVSLPFHNTTIDNHPLYDYIRFLTIILLALFLRGGLLILPTLSEHISTAFFAPLLATSSCTAWLVAITTVRSGTFELQNPKNVRILGVLLIGYAVLLHLVYLGSTELIQEEAYYWNYAQHLATGYLDHPPVVAVLIKLGTLLFGNNELGVRIGAFACWFVTALFAYSLTRQIFNRDTAFRAVILVAILPIFFGVALVITPDAPLIACWAGALYFLHRALIQDVTTSWYSAGVWIGIGLASKYTIVLLGPATVLYMLVDSSARKWFFKPQPYLAAILALVIFSPVIWWNYHNDWASFLFQSQGRLHARTEFSTHELLASAMVLLTPTGFLAVFASMRPHFAWRKVTQAVCIDTNNRNYFFCLIMALIPFSVFVLFSCTKEIKLNWTGPLWLSVLPFMAYTMAQGNGRLQGWVARIWPKTLVVLALSYGIVLHYSSLGLPNVPFIRNDFLFGWDDLAQQVEAQVQRVAGQEGERPLVLGMDKYRISSGLAFYRKKHLQNSSEQNPVEETAGSHLFGHNSLMYQYWLPPVQAADRDILVISQDKADLQRASFSNHYRHLGKIHDFSIKKQGKNAGRYYYRLLTRYTPEQQEGQTSQSNPGHSRIRRQGESIIADTTPAVKVGYTAL